MATDPIAALEAGLDDLLALDLVTVGSDQLLELVGRFEKLKRRLSIADHRLVAELDDRGVARELCLPSTAVLLSRLLRLDTGEARGRVRAAADLGPRRSLPGEVLPPLFARVAAAQATGSISPAHARVITATVDKLPAALAAENEAWLEAELVTHAQDFDPARVAILGRRLLDVLDPDGTLADDADHQRRREFSLVKYRDGSGTATARWTPSLMAVIEAFLDEFAAPRPGVDGTPDPRSAGQRNHDAIEEGFSRLVRGDAAANPAKGATLILTMTAEQFQTGRGYVTTAHDDLLSVPAALELVSDGQLMSVLFDPFGGVMSYGQLKRLVPRTMRLAITARDKGCTFPGCDRPPGWTQAHHFQEYAARQGPTSVENCGLVCGYHHREFGKRGWRAEMINGRPHWIPPAWIDPHQKPRLNKIHDPRPAPTQSNPPDRRPRNRRSHGVVGGVVADRRQTVDLT